MRLQKLKLTNIRSYESAELEFPDCSLLLSGDIGSGKTSILMAIEYALFGLQPGQKGSALLRNKALSGGVTLEFEINGEPVIIERALKREGKSVSNDYSAITINGEKTESSVTELKTKILQLLNYPPEFLKKNNLLYRYTVYTPQEQMKQIILEDPEVRLNILGHVFGIDKYKKIRENLAIILNKLKEDSKLLTGEIKTLDSDKSRLESTKNLVKTVDTRIEKKREEFILLAKKRGDIEKEVKELEEKIREKEIFEKEVEKTNVMIASKRENIFPLEKEMRELNRSLNETGGVFSEELLSQKKEQIKLKRDELERLNAQYVSLLSKISSLEETKRSTFEKKERVFKIDMCPTCLQNVPHAHKHNILNETERQLVELTASISSLENEKPGIKSAIDRTKLEIPKIEEEKMRLEILKSKISFIEKSRKRLDEIARLKATLESDLAFLSSHMDSLKENISEFSKFNNLYRVKQLDLERAFNDEKKCEISLAEFKKEKELMHREILVLEKQIQEKETSRLKLARILDISDWLSNQFSSLINYIERNVMIKLRMEFARLFGKWFHLLAGESFDVHLDENFTPLIVQGETEMEYSFLSGGERTAIALAYRLALNQTINSVLSNIKTRDIIILDEPTDGFSEFQLDKLRDVLHEIDVGQLVIVSHEQKIEGFVDSVVRLKKDANLSSIESPVL